MAQRWWMMVPSIIFRNKQIKARKRRKEGSGSCPRSGRWITRSTTIKMKRRLISFLSTLRNFRKSMSMIKSTGIGLRKLIYRVESCRNFRPYLKCAVQATKIPKAWMWKERPSHSRSKYQGQPTQRPKRRLRNQNPQHLKSKTCERPTTLAARRCRDRSKAIITMTATKIMPTASRASTVKAYTKSTLCNPHHQHIKEAADPIRMPHPHKKELHQLTSLQMILLLTRKPKSKAVEKLAQAAHWTSIKRRQSTKTVAWIPIKWFHEMVSSGARNHLNAILRQHQWLINIRNFINEELIKSQLMWYIHRRKMKMINIYIRL